MEHSQPYLFVNYNGQHGNTSAYYYYIDPQTNTITPRDRNTQHIDFLSLDWAECSFWMIITFIDSIVQILVWNTGETSDIYVTKWNWTTATGAPKIVVLRL